MSRINAHTDYPEISDTSLMRAGNALASLRILKLNLVRSLSYISQCLAKGTGRHNYASIGDVIQPAHPCSLIRG